MLLWMLVFVPVAILLEFIVPTEHLWVFLAASLAIIPLAGWLGKATEQLAERSGEGVGGLLNATFGNATELIIALSAMRAGLHDVVKASLAGSIVGNILLVLGAAMLAGGLRFHEQQYNTSAARSQATLLTLAAIALVIPAAYSGVVSERAPSGLQGLSLYISLVLLLAYGLFLVYSLVTHRGQFSGAPKDPDDTPEPAWSLRKALLVLSVATALIAWISEILVGAI